MFFFKGVKISGSKRQFSVVYITLLAVFLMAGLSGIPFQEVPRLNSPVTTRAPNQPPLYHLGFASLVLGTRGETQLFTMGESAKNHRKKQTQVTQVYLFYSRITNPPKKAKHPLLKVKKQLFNQQTNKSPGMRSFNKDFVVSSLSKPTPVRSLPPTKVKRMYEASGPKAMAKLVTLWFSLICFKQLGISDIIFPPIPAPSLPLESLFQSKQNKKHPTCLNSISALPILTL